MKEHLRIRKVTRKFDRSTGKFHFNIRFKTRTEVTPRTVAVAEAFGLGVDQHREFVIYDNLELKIGPRDVVLITGESGSGKSVLLRALEKDIRQDLNLGVVNIAEAVCQPTCPLRVCHVLRCLFHLTQLQQPPHPEYTVMMAE